MAVAKRMEVPTDRNDLLSKLQAGRDEQASNFFPTILYISQPASFKGVLIGREELTAEAFSFLIAGSDTTSMYVSIIYSVGRNSELNNLLSSTCAIIYYLACTPNAQDKLHKELDEHLDSEVATAERVKKLSYLQACINEGLRLHCTVGMGLHRVAAEPGMMISGNYIPSGTVVSAPTYTIHRDPAVWGYDVEEYRPERWFECDSAAVSKAFTPFSVGPRYVMSILVYYTHSVIERAWDVI